MTDKIIKGSQVQIHYDSEDTGGSGEWAALYVDGELVSVGDSYVAEEKAFSLLGVTRFDDSAFMRGQTSREGVAQTLDEVAAYACERDRRHELAEMKRVEARKLLEEARELESSAQALEGR